MTYSIQSRKSLSRGNAHGAVIDIDLTSYSTGGEDVSKAGLGIGGTPYLVHPLPRGGAFNPQWDKGNEKLLLKSGGERSLRTQIFPDIKGAQDADQNTDSASAATNGGHVLSLRTAQDETVDSGLTDPDYNRNVIVQLKANGGAGSMPDAGTVTVTGTDQFGNTISEEFDISAGEDFGANTIASGEHRWVTGSKVFATVTEVECDVDGNEANLQYSVGIGTHLGLKEPLDTPAAGDVQAVQKNTADVASGTFTVDTTNHSLQMGATLTDDDEVYIEYWSGAPEVRAGTNVGRVELLVEWGA